jgi:hypothetical protein
VICLGTAKGRCYFLSAAGEPLDLSAQQMTALGLLSLFGGNPEWMIVNYRKFDGDGKPTEDYVVRGVAGYLMRECNRAGMYDGSATLRGRGVWYGGPGLPPIVHCGETLWIDGNEVPLGLRGKAIYPRRPAVALPAFDRPATPEDGRQVVAWLRLWRYEGPIATLIPELLLGALAQGLLGDYAPWRTHISLSAQHASGKTAHYRLIGAAFGPQGQPYKRYTEAGLRRAMREDAMALILDEMDTGGTATDRIAPIIEMIRLMSSRDDSQSVTGGGLDGGADRTSMTGMVWQYGINLPPMAPQDRGRFLRVELGPLPEGGDGQAVVEDAIAGMAVLSPRLRARAVLRARLYDACRAVWRAGLMAAGCGSRQADTLSSLLAGRDIMLSDQVPDAETVKWTCEALDPLLAEICEDEEEDNDAINCLNALLGYAPDSWRGGQKLTIGQMIANGLTERTLSGPNCELLPPLGLRLEHSKQGPVLLVANRHAQLQKLFAPPSPWAGGGWKTSLSRLRRRPSPPDPNDYQPWQWPLPMRFGGVRSRALALPSWWLPPATGCDECG